MQLLKEVTSFKPPQLILAPMEGVTDAPMRHVLTELGGIDLCVSEFLRVTTSLHPKKVFLRWCPELLNKGRTASGVPVFLQLLGSDPVVLAENAARAAELGAPGIDLNFGCPAKTVNRHDGGATLLKYPDRLSRIVEAVRNAVPISTPVTAKMRLGFETPDSCVHLAEALESGGASWITVHARTKTDGYKPPAYWSYLEKIRTQLKIPVVANGEIWNSENLNQCRSESGCESFMIGRGIMRNPFLMQSLSRQAPCLKNPPGEIENSLSLVLDFYDYCVQWKSPYFAQSRTKQWLRQLAFQGPQALEVFETLKKETKPDLFKEKLLQKIGNRHRKLNSTFHFTFASLDKH